MKSDFNSSLDPKVITLIAELTQSGLSFTIVGGTVRDFYLGKDCKRDFDIEVRSEKSFDEAFTLLKTSLLVYGKVTEAKYSVLTLKLDYGDFEFSFPRVEKFNDEEGHSNFDAEFDPSLAFDKAIHRRDFTINAIGMKYVDGDFELQDPLGGVSDIEHKVLKPCSADFAKDPVRFLRAIRFSVLLDFEIDESILRSFPKKINQHFYFVKEAKKSKQPFSFLSKYLAIIGMDLDLKFPARDLKEIKDFFFLEQKVKLAISEATGFKLDMADYKFPLQLQGSKSGEILRELKKLNDTSEPIYSYMFKQGLVDIDYSTFNAACSQKLDMSQVESHDRERYRWDKILESF